MSNKDYYSLTLNKYQRDNLLWLLNAIGVGHEGIRPFTYSNTGDWAGEIYWMLDSIDDEPIDKGNPNVSLEDLKKNIENYINAKVQDAAK